MMKILTSEKAIILVMTVILFAMSYYINISTIIISTLSFLILMEAVRTVYDYVVLEEHKINVEYIIDGGVLFTIRELFVGLLMLKTTLILGLIITFVSVLVMGSLIYYKVNLRKIKGKDK